MHPYFVYILTNKNKTTLYTGVTHDLYTRLEQHLASTKSSKTFAGRYVCIYLVYEERHDRIDEAIGREKEIKGWSRAKKRAQLREFRKLNIA